MTDTRFTITGLAVYIGATLGLTVAFCKLRDKLFNNNQKEK